MKTCTNCGGEFEWRGTGNRSRCAPCYNAYQREWRRAHPGAQAAYHRKHRGLHPDDPEEVRAAKRRSYHKDLEKSREAQRLWRLANPEKVVERNRITRQRIREGLGYSYYKYGITTEEKAALLAAQGNRCPICQKDMAGAKPSIDHDHDCCPGERRTCGRCIRGILCSPCNQKLGWYQKYAPAIAAYLEAPRHESKPPTGQGRRVVT